ncbi:hypothetical protein [Lysobacter sp. Root604]|uniref:hypothetical protein n=1 Tax=Lysobacter sp. Root604 TaxID=1736568 RepID=UPI0012F84B93|nr:hypothetical protein [Lysobacter sp. Root604]
MKNFFAFSLFVVLLHAAPAVAAASARRVCVSPVKVKSVDRGLVLSPPGSPDFGRYPGKEHLVQIDNGSKIAVQEQVGTLLSVESGRKIHFFKVYRDKKIIHSFRFSFSRASAKCIVFNPAHESWSITDIADVSKCGCKLQ